MSWQLLIKGSKGPNATRRSHTSNHRHLSTLVAAITTLAAGQTALAQNAEPAGPIEEVIVTGSRIPQPVNMSSLSPIQTISDEEMKSRGTTDVADMLNTLPQVYQNAATDFSNTPNPLSSSGGMTTANLRGLGPQRTLVMIDGRRLGPADPSTGNPNPGPDLDQVPAALISSVDVVTGGASAVYGSDAIAGVVNFKLKRNFEGIQIDGTYGFNQHNNHNSFMQNLVRESGEEPPTGSVWDGHSKDLFLTLGKNFADGKANITAYAGYRTANPVYQRNRDFSKCQYNRGDGDNPITATNGDARCSGSANSNWFVPAIDDDVGDGYTVVGNQFLSWPQEGSSPPAEFNANNYTSLSRANKRAMYGAFFHYDVSDAFKPYVEIMGMRDKSQTEVAPSALFFGANPYSSDGSLSVNCDNPLLSAQQKSILCSAANGVADTDTGDATVYIGRRNVEGKGRASTYLHKNLRGVVGAGGEFASAWTYDVYGQMYLTTYRQDDQNYLSWTKINRALQVVDVNGTPTCKSVVDGTDPSCVPYNIFSEGGVTQEAVNYLYTGSTQTGAVRQKIVSANLSGDLGHYGIKLPTADSGVGVALGTEYRSDSLRYTPDENAGSGDLAGYAGAATTVDGRYNVRELYGETRVPLIQNRTAVKNLGVDAAVRYSDYSNSGGVTTYKLGLQYAPIHDINFRWSYQRAIRAANIIELYNPQSVTNTSEVATDPCAGFNPSALEEECARTGVQSGQYGSINQCISGQCSVLQGGNPDLTPEKSNTASFGFVFQPRFIPNFIGSIDYYRISLANAIGSIPLKFSLDQCLQTGDAFYCSLVKRTSSGALFGSTIAGGGYIIGTNINVGQQITSGIDLQLAYRWEVGSLGSMAATLSGAYVDKATSTPLPGEHTYDCAGLYGPTCQTVNPRWRHTMRLSWRLPADVMVALNWRYIGSVKLETNTSDETLSNGAYDPYNAKLGEMHYFDLSGSWDILPSLTVRAGINNILDRDPPLVDSSLVGTGAPNAYPTYDLLGRQVFMGFTAKF